MPESPDDPIDTITAGTLSAERVERALAEMRERIASIERRQADLQMELSAAREEEQLLERLLAIRRGKISTDGHSMALQPPLRMAGASKHPAIEEVVAILENEGRPLHISELMRLLQERGVPLPGAGTQANIIAHLRRDERVVRPARGMYGLKAWGLEEMAIPTPKTRRQRRGRRSPRPGRMKAKE